MTSLFPQEFRDNIPISNEDFFDGFDVAALAKKNGIPRHPLFLMPERFQPTREVWVAAKFLF